VQPDQHEQDDAEDEPVLLAPRRQLVAEEVVGVDVGNAVWPAREPPAVHRRVRSVHEHDERLAEEQRDDREVVPEQPPGRDPEYEAEEGGADDHDGNRDRRRPVDAVVLRGEESVEVGAEAEEGHVAEVEQPRVADDHIEAEAEEDVDEGEDPVREEVAAVHPERKRRRNGRKRSEARPRGNEVVDSLS
jgi:hypothetical protein